MKLFIYCLFALLVLNCTTPAPVDNSAQEAFEKNSKTVLDNLTGWQNENLDYSMYADDFAMMETGFNTEKDSLSLSEMMENDKNLWATYDFKMLNKPALLPGVNQVTKKPDGSVRHYSNWKITMSATDSTEAKSAEIRLYESFDFDSEGKIRYQQVYGDFSGIMMYLNSQE